MTASSPTTVHSAGVANGAADAGRLITFPLSHFCEKARWALDHAGLSYEELGYPPAVHKAHVVSRGSTTVPVLVSPEGTLRESTDIVTFADRACAPERCLLRASSRQAQRLVQWRITCWPQRR